MMHGGPPVRTRQRLPLRVADRNDRHVRVLAKERAVIGNVEPAVKGRHVRRALPSGQRKVHIIKVKVDDVELPGVPVNLFEQEQMMRAAIDARSAQPQRPIAARHQPGAGGGIPAGEQRDLMPLLHKLFGQVGDDAFGPAIQLRRHAFTQRGDLSDTHDAICHYKSDALKSELLAWSRAFGLNKGSARPVIALSREDAARLCFRISLRPSPLSPAYCYNASPPNRALPDNRGVRSDEPGPAGHKLPAAEVKPFPAQTSQRGSDPPRGQESLKLRQKPASPAADRLHGPAVSHAVRRKVLGAEF
jgi:hypothetical protein